MGGRILVVDDQIEIVDFFNSILTPLGHEVIEAHDGIAGLRRFRDELPDLVFLDLLLPKRDGSDVCAEIKATAHGLITPVVIVTGVYKNASKIDMMREYGVVDYLTKPMPIAKVTALVDWVLGPKTEEDTSPLEEPVLDGFALQPEADALLPGDLPQLLSRIETERQCGVLVACRGRIKKAFMIEDGLIVGGRSSSPADRIDRVLTGMRKLTPVQVAELRRQPEAADDFLAAVASRGLVDERGRDDALRFQAITMGLSLFRWSDVSARFFADGFLDCPRPARPIEPSRLVLLGLRKNAAHREALAQRQVRPETVFEVTERAAGLYELDLALRERTVLDLINGERNVHRLRQVGLLAQLPVDDALALFCGAGLVVARRDQGFTTLDASGTHAVGDLADLPFAEVLGRLMREEATGTLVIEADIRRYFVFHAGEVAWARSTDIRDTLGQVLLEEGHIQQDVLDQALTMQRDRRPDRRLGSLLVEMDVISVATLEDAVQRQMLRILETTFRWGRGAYVFEPEAPREGPVVHLGRDRIALLRDGIACMTDEGLWSRFILNQELHLRATGEDQPSSLLSIAERELLDRAEQGLSVDELVRDTHASARLRSVQLLVAAGLARVESRPRMGARPEPVALDRARTENFAAPKIDPAAAAAIAPDDPTGEVVLVVDEGEQLTAQTQPVLRAAAPDRPAASADAVGAILAFLKDELIAGRRSAEKEALALAQEVGRLRERVRTLEEENQRQALALAGLPAAAPALPDAPRALARRSAGEPVPAPAPAPDPASNAESSAVMGFEMPRLDLPPEAKEDEEKGEAVAPDPPVSRSKRAAKASVRKRRRKGDAKGHPGADAEVDAEPEPKDPEPEPASVG